MYTLDDSNEVTKVPSDIYTLSHTLFIDFIILIKQI